MIPDEVLDLPAVELGRRLDAGELTATALARAYLGRIERAAPKLNCFVTVTAERALADAARADAERTAGRRGPLLGLPYACKDAIDTAGIATTWGTKSQLGRVPARDATVVARLAEAGAVLLGKTSLSELCNALSIQHYEDMYPGPHRNPWDLARWAGGSSSGSASAVAAGLCAFAIGTETWGSIDTPAAFCGVAGLRPTYDLVPRTGSLTLSWTLDKIGVLCRDARDARLILPVLAAAEPMAELDPATLRIGIADQMAEPVADPANPVTWRAAKQLLADRGLALEVVQLPELPGPEAIGVILGTDIFVALDAFLRAEPALFDRQPVRDKVEAHRNNGVTADDYVRATCVRTMIQHAYRALLERVDVIACFGHPLLPTRFGEKPLELKKPAARTKLLPEGNLAGLPAITIPIGFTAQGLPRSMHLVAAPFEEHKLLAVAELFQRATDFHRRRPQL